MKTSDRTSLADTSSEISELIETLLNNELRLEELTAGQIDSVADGSGRTFLLSRAQQQLRAFHAARQAAILNALPAHIALLDLQGSIVFVNDSWRRFTGANLLQGPEFTVGMNYLEICDMVAGDVAAGSREVSAGIRAVLSGEQKSFTIEYPCQSQDEKEWFVLTVTPLSNENPAGAVVMHLNISAQKRAKDAYDTHRAKAEELTNQTEGRYRGLLEAAPDAMIVVNQAGEIVLMNVQTEKRFGYSHDELIGKQVNVIIPVGFAERILADGTRSAHEALEQQIGTGIELVGRRKDGSNFPIEIMLSPLENAEGILVTAAIRDISVRKKAEEHLAQMEGRYRGLLEAAPDAMVVVNQSGEIVLLNAQAENQFGYPRDELLGQKVTNIIPEGFAERLIADGLRSKEDALGQQIGTGIELNGLHKSGTRFPIEIMLSPLESPDGVLVTAAVRDITSRKKAEAELLVKVEQLKVSNEELGQFAYIASHDLQEPLRMVASYTQLLSKRYKGKLDSDADEFIAFAVDGANRMQRLIQDLLLYSRVGSKGKELRRTSSHVAFQQAVKNLRGSIEEKGAIVTHDLLPQVMADEMQLTQLFQNLVGNAIKYQSSGIPRVHVFAVKDGTRWLFSVQDNGLGIDSQYFERIFGMFQRLHKRDEFAGTGIGLAICKKIVERHGGSISVESQPGQGSTFRFALSGSDREL